MNTWIRAVLQFLRCLKKVFVTEKNLRQINLRTKATNTPNASDRFWRRRQSHQTWTQYDSGKFLETINSVLNEWGEVSLLKGSFFKKNIPKKFSMGEGENWVHLAPHSRNKLCKAANQSELAQLSGSIAKAEPPC